MYISLNVMFNPD